MTVKNSTFRFATVTQRQTSQQICVLPISVTVFAKSHDQTKNNTADYCAAKGYWQYSFITKVVSQNNKQDFTFDSVRTKALASLFASSPSIGKIFIEPHLKTRLNLSSDKIRFHGCRAVRHDDHIHVQLL
jgi:hypothetical protein